MQSLYKGISAGIHSGLPYINPKKGVFSLIQKIIHLFTEVI
jgi:hypothetical protein